MRKEIDQWVGGEHQDEDHHQGGGGMVKQSFDQSRHGRAQHHSHHNDHEGHC